MSSDRRRTECTRHMCMIPRGCFGSPFAMSRRHQHRACCVTGRAVSVECRHRRARLSPRALRTTPVLAQEASHCEPHSSRPTQRCRHPARPRGPPLAASAQAAPRPARKIAPPPETHSGGAPATPSALRSAAHALRARRTTLRRVTHGTPLTGSRAGRGPTPTVGSTAVGCPGPRRETGRGARTLQPIVPAARPRLVHVAPASARSAARTRASGLPPDRSRGSAGTHARPVPGVR